MKQIPPAWNVFVHSLKSLLEAVRLAAMGIFLSHSLKQKLCSSSSAYAASAWANTFSTQLPCFDWIWKYTRDQIYTHDSSWGWDRVGLLDSMWRECFGHKFSIRYTFKWKPSPSGNQICLLVLVSYCHTESCIGRHAIWGPSVTFCTTLLPWSIIVCMDCPAILSSQQISQARPRERE